MPISTRRSKEKELLSSDPERLERSICKEKHTSSIDTTSSSSINPYYRAAIDASTRGSIYIDPQADNMVATLVLTKNDNGDLHDPEGHLCNAAGQKVYAHGAIILEASAATEVDRVPRQRTIAEWIRPGQFYVNRSANQPPAIQGVDMKPTYFSYVVQHPFHGLPHENPLDHIETLENFVSCIQEHKRTEDYILCKLFKYSLSGNSVNRLKRLSPGSLTTWNEVKTVLLIDFFITQRLNI